MYEHIFNNLDWSILNNWPIEKEYIESEIRHGVYTKFLDVEPGDVVFDIGSSVGPFIASILDKHPKEIHCFEPHKHLYKALCKNFSSISNPIYFNCAGISNKTVQAENPEDFFPLDNNSIPKKVNTINFIDYIKNNNITKIDFLKTDCEGGEWSIFTEENYFWISNNIRKITGEFHLYDIETKDNFIKFRDLYLINASNVKAYIANKFANINLITDKIWDNNFVHENLNYCNISFEFGTSSSSLKPTAWIVDNFYEDPFKIRQFALNQQYLEGGLGRGFIGRRTEKQFLFPTLKKRFEQIMGRSIVEWESHGMNGRFQIAWSGEPLVYHCDSQRWAGMLYLTPNAPYSCGTSLLAHKVTRARSYYDTGWDASWTNVPGDPHLDGTPFEPVDVLGNVFNRLVIFDASCIHSASQYFGTVKENSRLWQMFFFD